MSTSVDRAPWVVVASRFNAAVVDRLLEGARRALAEAGVAEADVTIVRCAGAWEVPLACARLAGLHLPRERRNGPPLGIVALGAVVRGQTPHFDYLCQEVARGLGAVARESGVAVGFGVLTCDTMEQALARAGGAAGNKGFEAAVAALDLERALGPHETNP